VSWLRTQLTPWLRRNELLLEHWLPILLNGIKISAVVGTGVGLILVLAYLGSSGAPLPLDLASTIAFVIVAILFGAFGGMLGAIILLPSIPMFQEETRLKKVLGKTFILFIWLFGILPLVFRVPIYPSKGSDLAIFQVLASSLGESAAWLILVLSLLFIYRCLSVGAGAYVYAGGIALILIEMLMFGPSFAGRIVLRELGIGGGIPVKLLIRTMRPGGSNVTADNVRGCLILNLGGRVILRPLEKPTRELCAEPIAGAQQQRTELKGLHVYSSSDVIEMTGPDENVGPDRPLGPLG
jgi:hypothetical protein